MSKFGVAIIFAIVIAILIIGGVVKVEVDIDRLATLPQTFVANVNDPATVESWRVGMVKGKRTVEGWIFQDEAKQLDLATIYVEADAERLHKLIEKNDEGADVLLPQAQLLDKSVTDLRETAASAPTDAVVENKEKARRALSLAYESFDTLTEIQENHSETNENFVNVTESLSEQLGEISLEEVPNAGAVAGSTDETFEEEVIPEDIEEELELRF